MRYRPLIPVQVIGPLGSRILDACLDTGTDDTLFPVHLATRLGIDLTGVPEGEAISIGGVALPYRYAQVTLRISDGYDEYEWEGIVGFISASLRWAVQGHAAVLQFFDVQLFGYRHELILVPNGSYPGSATAHLANPP